MRLTWIAVSFAFAVEMGAQGAVQSSAQQPPPSPAAAAKTGTITVTGCLQSITGGSGAASSGSHYRLSTATTTPGASGPSAASGAPTPSPDASGASRTAEASGSSAPPTGYVLHGRADELGKHTGHRVEITGTVSEGPASGAVATAGTSAAPTQPETQVIPHEPHRGPVATGTGGNPSGSAAAQHLSVQSVRMLATSCQ
jgi:hypothetical protein